MDAYRFYHENSKEYTLQDRLTRNAVTRSLPTHTPSETTPSTQRVALPDNTPTEVSKWIRRRSSTREFSPEPISLKILATVLRDSYGLTGGKPVGRVVPSAGARYPLDLSVIAFRITGLDAGIYRYAPAEDALVPVSSGEYADKLATYSHKQDGARDAAAMLLVSARFERSTSVYGERGYRHTLIEAGHLMQNAYLSCAAADLGICANGGFDDNQVGNLCELGPEEDAVYAAYIGQPSTEGEDYAE